MRRLESWLTRCLEALLAFALFVIAAVIVMQVFLSFAMNSSITGANELVTKLFVYTSTIGAAVTIGKNEHIQISLAADLLPKALQVVVHRVVLLLVGVLNFVMLVYSFHWIQITGDYLMPTTQLPRYVVQISVPVGCGLAVIYCGLRVLVGEAGVKEASAR